MTAGSKRTALVTGGSRGIGLGIARALVREGWSVAINGVRPASAVQDVVSELRGAKAEVIYCQGDVSVAEDRQSILRNVVEHFGALHLLVNNAGITSPGRADILDATKDAFDRVMAVNLKGALFWLSLQRSK